MAIAKSLACLTLAHGAVSMAASTRCQAHGTNKRFRRRVFFFAEPNPDVQRLARVWESQRTEIITANIRFRSFRRKVMPLSRTAASKLVAKYDLANNPDSLRDLIIDLLGGAKIEGPRYWTNSELIVDGKKVRSGSLDPGGMTQVFNGEAELNFIRDNDQIDISRPSKQPVHRDSLADLRLIPRIPKVEPQVTANAATVVLRWPVLEIETNRFGDVLRVAYYLSADRGTRIIRESFQTGWKEYPGGIRFSSARIDFFFDASGTLSNAPRLLVIDAASFNEPVSENSFTIETKGDAKVVDYRYGTPDSPRVRRVGVPMKDAYQAIQMAYDPQRLGVARDVPQSRGAFFYVGLAAMTLAVIGLLIGVVRNRKQRAEP